MPFSATFHRVDNGWRILHSIDLEVTLHQHQNLKLQKNTILSFVGRKYKDVHHSEVRTSEVDNVEYIASLQDSTQVTQRPRRRVEITCGFMNYAIELI